MALLLLGSAAAVTGTALFVAKKTRRSRYHSFRGEEDPRFDFDESEDPERVKSLTKYYSIDFPDVLVGWRVHLADGRRGVIVNCKRRFMRAARYEIAFEGKSSPEAVVLNRKNHSNRRKYIDFDLVGREF